MATLTISFNGLSRSWEVSAAHQLRVLNALKDNYAVDGVEPSNAGAFEIATDGFVNGLIDITDTFERREASDAATASITPVAFTEN